MTEEQKKEATGEVDVIDSGDEKPFDEISESRSVEIISGALGELVTIETADELAKHLVASEDLERTSAPHISKALLVGMPFVLRDIQVIPDGAVADDTGEVTDLIIAAGQAVKIDGVGRLADVGYVFTFTVGAEGSVLGGQILEDAAGAKASGNAVLYRTGLAERTTKKGTYFTVRPTIENKALDLFKR